jgi:repressor LexA
MSASPPAAPPPLTARQAQILGLIRRILERTGLPPTRAEIAATLGFRSANAAEEHLRALARKGLIEVLPGTARGLRLTALGRMAAGDGVLDESGAGSRDGVDLATRASRAGGRGSSPASAIAAAIGPELTRSLRLLPLLGRVAAGAPILAAEHVLGHHAVDPHLFRPSPDYLLTVRGSSMRDAGIIDGDLLVVHQTTEARSGQIVVARLDDEVTVKRWQQHADRIELLPANPDFAPIVVAAGDERLAIEGLVVGLIRNGLAVNS